MMATWRLRAVSHMMGFTMETDKMKNGDCIPIPMTRTDWADVAASIDNIGSPSQILLELRNLIHRRLREPRNPADTRYRLLKDNDGHSYVVPVSYEGHFDKILLDEGDPAEYYTMVDGRLSFTDPLEL